MPGTTQVDEKINDLTGKKPDEYFLLPGEACLKVLTVFSLLPYTNFDNQPPVNGNRKFVCTETRIFPFYVRTSRVNMNLALTDP